MEHTERIEPLATAVVPQHCGKPGCEVAEGSNTPSTERTNYSYVFALGRVEPRFPRLAVEKEFAQATGRAETTGLTDRQALHSILAQRQNRYLVRQLCWVLTIEGLETYILLPRDVTDFDLLVEAVRPVPRRTDLDVIIGARTRNAPPEMCNGLIVPIVMFDQIYSFDTDSLIKSIPLKDKAKEQKFEPAAEELFERIIRVTDNAGATDEHRALNYLAVRYPAIYTRTADAFAQNASLTGIEVRPSPLSGIRRIMDVIFSFTNRNTDFTEKSFVRVDVTEEFPFMITKLSPYFNL